MQAILTLLLIRLPGCICFLGAIYLLAIGVTTGWGWLLFIGALCCSGSYSYKSSDEDDKNA